MENILDEDERATWSKLISDPKSVGHAMLTGDGNTLSERGLSDMAVPVAANLFDVCRTIGELLGEEHGCKQFCIVGKDRDYIGVAFKSASALIVQSTVPQGEIKELRNVR